MSKDGSIKEFIFNLTLMQHNDLLQPFIGLNRLNELERYHVNNNRIDITGRTIGKNIPIYIETQRTTTDNDHFIQVKKIIETIDDGIMIWIAPRFTTEQLNKMDSLMKRYEGKPIKVLAISFNKEYLAVLDRLNKCNLLEIWQEINKSCAHLPELIFIKEWGSDFLHYQPFRKQITSLNLTDKKQMNLYFLQILKRHIPYLFNLYRSKINLDGNVIRLGAGRADLSYHLSICNGFFKFRMDSKRNAKLFNQAKEAIRKNIDYCFIEYNDKEVIFHLPDIANPKERIAYAVNLFKLVADTIIPITYNR